MPEADVCTVDRAHPLGERPAPQSPVDVRKEHRRCRSIVEKLLFDWHGDISLQPMVCFGKVFNISGSGEESRLRTRSVNIWNGDASCAHYVQTPLQFSRTTWLCVAGHMGHRQTLPFWGKGRHGINGRALKSLTHCNTTTSCADAKLPNNLGVCIAKTVGLAFHRHCVGAHLALHPWSKDHLLVALGRQDSTWASSRGG